LSILKTFSEGDVDVEREFAEAFVQQSDENISALAQTRGAGSLATWNETAHLFKGGAAGMGAYKLAELCHKAQLFKGSDVEQNNLLEMIAIEYARTKGYLKEIGLLS
jgi:HPt (histidine-containing phosphotransfer) domain-containing protein